MNLRSPGTIPDNLVLHCKAALDSNCDDLYLVGSGEKTYLEVSFK